MKIAIIGAGGVGGYFGGKLATAGNDVTFVARGTHLVELQRNGLIVKSIGGDFSVKPVKATDKIKDVDGSELVIIAVKAWQVNEVAEEINDIVDDDSIVLPLQNGVLAASELREEIRSDVVIGGLCRIFSKIESPGVINHFGVTPTIVFGELDTSNSTRIQKLKSIFDGAGINSKVADDINSELWKKFIAICVSGLLAVTRTTYGEMRGLNETRQMMFELLTEGYKVSKKMGIKIEPGYVDKTISFIDTFPYDSTSSLTRDVWEGKPSEIDYQNGTIVKFGGKYGVSTPVNRFIYNCILPLEKRAREKNV
jgi:2-dehydropantoate 2-reductase